MHWEVKVPGSCGELVQGTKEGVPFLVTCPINLYTTVTVTEGTGLRCGFGAKSHAALRRVLAYLGEAVFPSDMTLVSELPIGKGMASSSADIAAVAFAAALTLGKSLTAAEVSRIAAGIEPTDGVFFPGIVRLNHMTGECQAMLGDFPPLKIAVFDTGGAINTVEFHRRGDLARLSRENEAQTMAALDLLSGSKEPEAIAEAATKSALANQTILPKRDLSAIIETARNLGALGVNAAHSGTILGVLFPPEIDDKCLEQQAFRLADHHPHLKYLQGVTLISGGYCYVQRE